MKFCEACGAELEENERFCSQCGRPVSEDSDEKPRDLWAERLNRPQVGKPAEKPEEKPSKPKKKQPEKKTPREPEPLPEDFWEEPVEKTRILVREKKKKWWQSRWLWGGVAAYGLAFLVLMVWPYLHRNQVPILEHYYGRTCTVGQREYPAAGDWITLDSQGDAVLCLLGSTRQGTWEKSGRSIVITCGDDFLLGTLEEGILSLSDGDRQFVLSQQDVQPVTAPAQPPVPTLLRWEGDYYGWWQITEAWGAWEKSSGDAFDVCGRIFTDPEGRGGLELWDTQCGAGELFCAADLEVLPGVTENGRLRSGTGRFCDFLMEPGLWDVDPGLEPYKNTPGLLRLGGSFACEDSGFSYQIFLMPWGSRWEPVEQMPLGLMPGGKKLPPHYKDWYLPLIEGNYRMPETFREDLG